MKHRTCVQLGGTSSAVSLANSLLLDGEAVALVLDSDSIDESDIEERRIVYRDALRRGGARGSGHVFLVAPESEALFFADRAFVERVLGPVDERTLLLGRVKPSRVIADKLGPNGRDLMLRRLEQDGSGASAIARDEIVQQVAGFLREPRSWKAPGAPALTF